MKKRIFLIIAAGLLLASCAGTQSKLGDLMKSSEGTGADQKLTAITDEITAPTVDDLIYAVDDPGATGTGPTSSKMTMLSLIGACPAVNTKSGAYTIGTDNPWELYCGVIYVTSTATITAPSYVAATNPTKQCFSLIAVGASTITLSPNSIDKIVLDGDTTPADDQDIVGTGTAGDIATCTAYPGGIGWGCETNGWTAP